MLTDNDLTVISLLRVVNEENEQLRIGLKYSLQDRQNYYGVPAITRERVQGVLQRAVEKGDYTILSPQKRPKRKPEDALRKALASSLNELPPLVIDHALQVARFDPKTPAQAVLSDSSLMDELINALEEAQDVVNNITKSKVCRGYIIAKPAKIARVAAKDDDEMAEDSTPLNLTYEDFHPFRPQQFKGNPEITILEFDGFNKTVDEFFSSIESQKISSRLTEREENAKRKLETARLDHENRLGGLQRVQEKNIRQAQAIEANLPRVQEAITALNGLLAQGMDWMDVGRLIEMEQAKHNAVADIIQLPLKLYENTATLLLSEARFGENDDYEGKETDSEVSDSSEDGQDPIAKSIIEAKTDDRRLAVDIDLALSPWSNARLYYDQKKSAAVKEQKTLQSSEKALKSTAKKISADLKKGLKQEKEVLRPQRKAFWFEKFLYFISSEGYLVIAGKDAPQNEILYKRYLKKGDVYIHADLHGAASVIVKNKARMINSPIPPSTLSQAGNLAVATSSAWDSKAGMSAWWVNADQVSKTAPTGEYLTTGAFTVGGHKNFLPPAQLLLGFGLLFKVSEDSKARHLKHRIQDQDHRPSGANEKAEDGEQAMDETEEDNIARTGSDKDDQHDQSDHPDADAVEMDNVNEAENDNETDDDESEGSHFESEQQNPLQPTQSRHHKPYPQDNGADKLSRQTSSQSGISINSQSRNEPKIESEERYIDNGRTVGDQKRHITAKERLALRKGASAVFHKSLGTANGTSDSHEGIGSSTPSPSAQIDQTSALAIKSQPTVRGKHGKHNKLKTKYADQDEEDRALAMRLLGSAAAQEKANADAASKVAKEQELAEQKQRRRRQHELTAKKGKELEEIRRLNFEEGIETLDDGEKEEMDDLDAFVGAPLPGDEILDVLVMCGPWDAIGGRCRWRVKLQPGTTKKGKAVREILSKWVSTITDREKKRKPGSGAGNETMVEEEKTRSREADLIRAIRESEVIGVVPVSKVRVVMGPGEASGKGRGSGGAGKGKRGGKGSKKQR